MKESGLFALTLALLIGGASPSLSADVGSWCPEGQKAYSAGKFDEANTALNSCLYSPPDDSELAAEAYVMRGETYVQRLDYEAALSDFDRALELSPQSAEAWRSKAWVHYKTNDLHPAVVAIENSLKADSQSTRSHHIHALILTALGRPEAAMDAYDLAYSFESRSVVQGLQQELERQGYDIRAIDGVYGSRTRDALKECIADRCVIPL